jgi:hypothetical protein
MSVTGGRSKLNIALKDLRVKFERTQDAWDDIARDGFQKRHLDPLEPCVRTALAAMDKMTQMVNRAKNECG